MTREEELDTTRRSWNAATRIHNSHKGDQVAFFRNGGDVLFPEELDLLGPLDGRRVVHLQCNAGQDTLGLARRGAQVVGVDFSDEAISFARNLSRDSGIYARFEQAEVVDWMMSTEERFELAFTSYGTTGWLPDLPAWARGISRILEPGGRFVYVEFHPLVWSYEKKDEYFAMHTFMDPVGDYVGESGGALQAAPGVAAPANDIPACSWQHPLGSVLNALIQGGLQLESFQEYAHSNGDKTISTLVEAPGRRWVWPEGAVRLPLMYSVTARRP